MQNDWQIKKRSATCSATGRPFEDGEEFHTLLFFEDNGEWRRVDLCEEAWRGRNDNIRPFSAWKSTFQAPPPPEREAVPRENAESLLRAALDEDDPGQGNLRYILALMLERRKTLRHTDTRETGEGRLLIYEHATTGEVFLIPDPQLRLDELDRVRDEVAAQLGVAPRGEVPVGGGGTGPSVPGEGGS